jgi:aminomethyltransferase
MTVPALPAATSAAPESPLLAEHIAAGAVLTSFAGWTMPLRYGSELAEHHAVRTAAGLFDLSHMGQLEVSGPSAAQVLDRALVSTVSTLAPGRARYTVMTGHDGGVLDDLIVYRLADGDYLVISNAANRLLVRDVLTERSAGTRTGVVDRTEQRALVALQGPVAATVLAGVVEDADVGALRYYGITPARMVGVPVLVARTGYTGEDGFEISVPAASAPALWRRLLAAGAPQGVVACGLACRDTLRLEAGMPLYGHELTPEMSPYEAGLGRIVHLDHAFVGRAALAQRAGRASGRVLVGMRGEGRRAARAGYAVLRGGTAVGVVTSGALSPTLGYPIAMAHVDRSAAGLGTVLDVDVRGSLLPMEVVPLPFYRRAR